MSSRKNFNREMTEIVSKIENFNKGSNSKWETILKEEKEREISFRG